MLLGPACMAGWVWRILRLDFVEPNCQEPFQTCSVFCGCLKLACCLRFVNFRILHALQTGKRQRKHPSKSIHIQHVALEGLGTYLSISAHNGIQRLTSIPRTTACLSCKRSLQERNLSAASPGPFMSQQDAGYFLNLQHMIQCDSI